MSYNNITSLYPTCPTPSVGVVNTLVSTLVQSLLVAQCSISSPKLWPEDYAATALRRGLSRYDFIIVGAGSAGSVVASRLSENPDWRVLVLEAGGDPPQESEVPQLFFSVERTPFNWNYFANTSGKACQAMNNAGGTCYWPRGKMIGGSGQINAMLYVRGNRQDYDHWRDLGNEGWGYDDVLPYFEKSIRPVGNATHPEGFLTVNEFNRIDVQSIFDMFYDGAAELGIPKVPRFEEGTETGYSALPGTVGNGLRQSPGKGFLSRVSERPNLHVIKNAQVTRINFDRRGERVESVSFVVGRRNLQVRMRRELILSAGTIDSAKLLQLSGIGPRSHLQSLRIPVVHDLHVGDNLQDHLMVPVFFRLQASGSVPFSQEEMLDNVYNYLIHKSGPLSSHGTFALTGFINTVDGSTSPYPDAEFHHLFIPRGYYTPLQIWLTQHGFQEQYANYILSILSESNLLVVFAMLALPKSAGNVRVRSSNYRDAPNIVSGYLEDPDDTVTLLRAIRHLTRLEATQAFQNNEAVIEQIPIEECDEFEFKSDEYWRCYMKYITGTVYHQTGTVKMGPQSDPTACVDARLRLYGLQNLRVIDASIMPNVTSCNTNAPTVMIAEKGADYIKEDWNFRGTG